MSQEKKSDKSDKIVEKRDGGKYTEPIKKEIVRKAETETAEPIIRPTEKPKK